MRRGRSVEGQHPQLIKDVFDPVLAVDAGCGPNGVFLHLLREVGVKAIGFDIQVASGCGDVTYGDLTDPYFPSAMGDLVICREVLEHLTVPHLLMAVRNLMRISTRYIYLTTRFHPAATHLLDATTDFGTDPTHVTCLTKTFLAALFVAHGCQRREDLEARMDWHQKGRCLVFEVRRG